MSDQIYSFTQPQLVELLESSFANYERHRNHFHQSIKLANKNALAYALSELRPDRQLQEVNHVHHSDR